MLVTIFPTMRCCIAPMCCLLRKLCLYLFECEGLVLLKGLLRQRSQFSDLLHALLFLLEQHALPVGHLLQLLGVMVDGIVLLLLNVLPALHALYVFLDLCLGLVDERIQIWEGRRLPITSKGQAANWHSSLALVESQYRTT